MFKKYVTISIIPNSSKKVKSFSISTTSIFCLFIILLIFVASSAWILTNYFSGKNILSIDNLAGRVELQKKFLQQSEQNIQELEKKLANLNYSYDFLTKSAALSNYNTEIVEESPSIIKKLKSGESSILSLIPSKRSEVNFSSTSFDFNSFPDFFADISQTDFLPKILPAKGFFISNFGEKSNLLRIKNKPNTGIVLYTNSQEPVVATLDGVVVYAGSDDILSKSVTIYHSNYVFTKYGYLSDVKVKKLQKVSKGDIIGFSGEDENSFLFYQISFLFIPSNPFLNL